MHQKHWKFLQTTPSSTWLITNVPLGAEGPVITHIETDDGVILQPEQQRRVGGDIELLFGVQDIKGTAYGQYYTEEDSMSITTPGGIVNVTVNQYAQGKEPLQ